jgi:Zn-dependent protease with chaperone function
MKRLTGLFLKFRLLLFFLFLSWPCVTGASFAQLAPPVAQTAPVPDSDRDPSIDLGIRIENDGTAVVHAEFDTALEQKYNFAKMLSATFDCPLPSEALSRDEDDGSTFLSASCKPPITRSFLAHSGTIDLRTIKDIQSNDPTILITVNVLAEQGTFAKCDPAPDNTSTRLPRCAYLFDSPSQTPNVIRYQFGYHLTRALLIVGVLGFLLLLPIALTFWFRRQASTAPEEAKPAVSFAHRRFLTKLMLFGTLAWWAGLDLLRADSFVAFLFPVHLASSSSALADTFPLVLLWIPPAIVYFVCLVLSAPMHQLRGTDFTRQEILSRSFWSVARLMIPLPLIIFGIMEIARSPRWAIPLIFAGFIVLRLASAKFMRVHGMEFFALSSGELRDRAFALADQAHARLNQLYVFPMTSMRVANAFAHSAQNVFLTDYLVNNLGKPEVDAVVAHEIAHLQKKHIARRLILIVVVAIAFTAAAIHMDYSIPPNFPTGPVIYGAFLLIIFFVSRRNEFAADAGSAKLTGNAEAMITALARISRLNTMPLQWNKFDENLLTHPSTLKRIRRLASNAGISESRTAELLAQSFTAPVETYSIPPTALPAGKIFSTRYKTQLQNKIAWSLILTTLLVPAIAASLVRWAGLAGEARWAAYLTGFVLTLAADWTLLNFLPMLGVAKLERRFREKCREQHGGSGTSAGIFVGLAPHSNPRIYEGNWSWDIGFLSLTPDRIFYRGEESQFELSRDQITSIWIGPGAVGWFRTPAIYFSWRDPAGHERTFNLRPLTARSMRELGAKTRLLLRDLENWLNRASPSTPASLVPVAAESAGQGFKPPAFGIVTGIAPRTAVRGAVLARDFLLNSFLALGVILMFGLSLPFFQADSPRTAADVNSAWGGAYVLVVVWLARALTFAPYRRASDAHASPQKQAPHTP